MALAPEDFSALIRSRGLLRSYRRRPGGSATAGGTRSWRASATGCGK